MSEFRLLVTGSRSWPDPGRVRFELAAVLEGLPDGDMLVVVHGDAPGVDSVVRAWARRMRWQDRQPVREEPHPAQNHPTEDFGRWPGAGPRRNQHMVSLGADRVLAFPAPCTAARCSRPRPHDSHGTADCMRRAREAGIDVREVRCP